MPTAAILVTLIYQLLPFKHLHNQKEKQYNKIINFILLVKTELEAKMPRNPP